ncbi:predicted protein [Chaetoceros tenuissimus]|uniref:Uncharacterized protein n=1 Tax=Chaetoceros tenuissimus TaxID=426638 RepID=A0AAD3HE21_9STRA|nr:predicted protein [Chaetoceros tenuissimus]
MVGVASLPNSKFKSRISNRGILKDLGQFQLESDAGMVYDEARKLLSVLTPSVHRPKPNFDDFDQYEEARKEELQSKYNDIETDKKIDFETFAKKFPIPYDDIKQAVLCEKLGLDRLDLIMSRKYTFLHPNGKVNTELHDLCWSCGKQENGCRHPSLKFPTCQDCSDPVIIGGIKCSWCFEKETEEVFECDGKEGTCKKQFCGDCVFMSQGGGREGAEYVKRIRKEGESGTWICPYCEPTPTLIALRAIPVIARVKEEEEDIYQGLLGSDDSFFPPSDDEADLLKAKKPRVSSESNLPNNGSMEKEVIDLVSSDEEDNDESISISRAVPVESMKSTSMSKTESVTASIPSSESLNAKEEIMDSRVVQTGEANAAHSIIAETYPSTEENVVVENRAQTKSGVGSPTVLKNSLMQILEIPIETIEESEVVKDKIMEYCEKLFDCQGCYTNDLLITYLKGLSPGEFDINMNFMLLSHQKQVKKWLENQREEG